MKIQPVQTWQNGQQKEATNFILTVTNDNLSTAADFQFKLTTTPVNDDKDYDVLVMGYLTMSGEEYQTWDADPSANAWAYNWAAEQLNLVLIPE